MVLLTMVVSAIRGVDVDSEVWRVIPVLMWIFMAAISGFGVSAKPGAVQVKEEPTFGYDP